MFNLLIIHVIYFQWTCIHDIQEDETLSDQLADEAADEGPAPSRGLRAWAGLGTGGDRVGGLPVGVGGGLPGGRGPGADGSASTSRVGAHPVMTLDRVNILYLFFKHCCIVVRSLASYVAGFYGSFHINKIQHDVFASYS